MLFEERKPAGKRYRDDILQERAAPLQLRFDGVCFGLFRGDHRADVSHEIDSRFVALHTSALLVAAGRAFETHRHVAALTESSTSRTATPHLGQGIGAWEQAELWDPTHTQELVCFRGCRLCAPQSAYQRRKPSVQASRGALH